jgi:anthranilate synthase component 1
MFTRLSLEQFLEVAKTEKRIAVYQEIPGDRITAISAFEVLGEEARGGAFLESAVQEKDEGRYSLLGFQALAEVRAQNGNVTVVDQDKREKTSKDDAFAVLKQQFQKMRCKTLHPLSGFIGGMAGCMTYDAVRLFENIPDKNPNDLQLPEFHFKFYKHGIVFDHETNKAVITTLVEIDKDPTQAYEQAMAELGRIKDKIFEGSFYPHPNPPPCRGREQEEISSCKEKGSDFVVEPNDATFMQMVERAKHHITIGDAFQIVVSRVFRRKFTVKPFDIYRALRFKSPAPYMFYLDYGTYQVVGASPERLVRVRDNIVYSSPLAGTRPRGTSPEQDEALAQELLQNNKEVAEHMMLVDLARNDVGAIAEPGQVTVKELLAVKKFSHVMHISSTVEGHLKKGLDALDALRASFPAGTLSGAPKIRAMEIIDELENSRRGLYGGAICSLNANGDLESCIAIRMAVLKDGVATIRAGAGIVFDSVPQDEADETRHKSKSVLEAIAWAEGEIA